MIVMFQLWICIVFYGARDFNNDLSAWNVSAVTSMVDSTYTLFTPFSKIGSCFCVWVLHFNFLTTMCVLSPLFSPTHLIIELLCFCGAVFRTATNFNVDISTWNTGNVIRMDGSTFSNTFCVVFADGFLIFFGTFFVLFSVFLH